MAKSGHAETADPAAVKRGLAAIVKDERALKTLKVTYDDMHGLHGGLTLTIFGDGRVEQKEVRTKVGKLRDRVAKKDLQRLAALLLEVEAWKQKTPERMAVPDESHSRLYVSVDGSSSEIWEWYNEMQQDQRIYRVRELMKQIAWQ